jgi:hypothetical protein
MGSGYPADACGAICLSFRALVRALENIRSVNLEMIRISLMIIIMLTLSTDPILLLGIIPHVGKDSHGIFRKIIGG